jgi:hypothetical protein
MFGCSTNPNTFTFKRFLTMTNSTKNEIKALLQTEISRLGSAKKVANSLDVSQGVISFMLNDRWDMISQEMWNVFAVKLQLKTDAWQMADIGNTRMMYQVLQDAKTHHLHLAVSYRAGSGKSATVRDFTKANAVNGVFALTCREWGRKEFLTALCSLFGISINRGLSRPDQQLQAVCEALNQRAAMSPLLVVDEADKLRPAALRILITLYNECEGRVGVVIVGTENLRIEIQRGIRLGVKGMDEIDSRFGRRYVQLGGSQFQDVLAICKANGINDTEAAKRVWSDSEPTKTVVANRQVELVFDLRRVRRCIERELLQSQNEQVISQHP